MQVRLTLLLSLGQYFSHKLKVERDCIILLKEAMTISERITLRKESCTCKT